MAIVCKVKRCVFLISFLIYGISFIKAQGQQMPAFERSALNNPLPDFKKSFIESAELSQDPTGFRIRGIKGWAWTTEQYLEEIPWLSKYKMNFLMNCFVSLYSHQKKSRNDSWNNDWWLPLRADQKKGIEAIIDKCKEYAISFCFSMHPQLNTKRPINLGDEKDYKDFFQHYEWAQQKGVSWFSICLDDVYADPSVRISGKEQATFVNMVFNDLKKVNAGTQMIFCPTWYWGTGENEVQKKYFDELAQYLHKDVFVFWTGNTTRSPQITLKDAAAFKEVIKHKIILWDNYPANDGRPTMHLQPVSQRDRDLYKVIDGYMALPMASQNQITRIPLFTAADFAFSPQNYNPNQSILESIVHQTDDKKQQQILLELVKLYSSDTITASTRFNPILHEFERINKNSDNKHHAYDFIVKTEKVLSYLKLYFPNAYDNAKATIAENITEMKLQFKNIYKSDRP